MTEQRLSPDKVIFGLETKSAKIRALANAGYDRTEIGQYLGIRYQHVRKVLLDAGITTGLRRQVEIQLEPVIVDPIPAPRETASWNVLLSADFHSLGAWIPDPESAIQLDNRAPGRPGVYAFIVDEAVVYVGLTNTSLHARLDGYRRGHEGQRTNARVKKLIVKALSDGKSVKVLIATPEPLDWNGLPVNTAAGLESGLIQMMRPSWNILGAI